jgi:hypothetical protein
MSPRFLDCRLYPSHARDMKSCWPGWNDALRLPMFPVEYLSPDWLMVHAITFLRFEFTNPPGE